MKAKKLTYFISFILIILMSQTVWGQKKLAQTGFQFLSVVPDARSAAMANAMTTVSNNSSALWDNPALLSEMEGRFNLTVTQNQWLADIKHNALSLAVKPFGGQFGVFGVSLLLVDYGEVEGTIVANNEQGYLETGMIKPTAYAVGLGYAKALTNKFSVGGQIKYASQYLGPVIDSYSIKSTEVKTVDQEASVLAFDFGTNYRTGFKSLVFGMSVRNFSKEIKFSQEEFQLPLIFSIGFSANIMDFVPERFKVDRLKDLLLTIDAVHPRSYPEYLKTGLEYRFAEILSLRMGYYSNVDERSFTYGIGLNKFGFQFDYAYVPFGVFDNVQRFTLKFSW
ncbi:MAG: PorV/PorQ family protein [Calditrichaeota bacterium]|nr:PorV/PorQ family protein [Calditrichota bacterium]